MGIVPFFVYMKACEVGGIAVLLHMFHERERLKNRTRPVLKRKNVSACLARVEIFFWKMRRLDLIPLDLQYEAPTPYLWR